MLDISRHKKLISGLNLKNIKILVAGAGGLGSTVLNNLVRFGFENIIIYDPKMIDPPDLNRQILYNQEDLYQNKAFTALKKLKKINPNCNIKAIDKALSSHFNEKVDIAFDCMDNIEGRLVLEKICKKLQIPMIHGAVQEFSGQVTVIVPGITTSLLDIYEGFDIPKTPQVFPPTVLVTASIQVSEAIKILKDDFKNALINKILFFNLLYNDFEILQLI
ncbi:UBA/THIF-type NAD/FAD binding protein [Thermosipho africanus H17ap60334]|jgi:molybdopterin/thiamine biosynthesis adenylyltransferase|uniref:HesA/MoeB/ThiF family protein n=1 Tax=Thermosipho TaxID=2420 RepID=UPI00028EBCD3|nr:MULTISPECIES: HesA/MoeB/ThiF family protein [Thermosipho]HCF38247.1 HesA/MoeB/ThiF family protein [Thermosipho africanus]EKF49879.1 UBA/THIF-type NAD/FAD binding protein [Thermosipho africanus H17ap60334]MBZ4650084.1 UBA/THIF-type binding protein [Thermosipho sp. (in: thermotogales)]MDK2838942.1 molybdopterin-synthase adenylyltransferase [Thermosipho sp. (in: thermotogales)]MDK2899662.1 molybdopterin-synthase adenylyltransferase [Thermosipho sp. (in: thermotogales)]